MSGFDAGAAKNDAFLEASSAQSTAYGGDEGTEDNIVYDTAAGASSVALSVLNPEASDIPTKVISSPRPGASQGDPVQKSLIEDPHTKIAENGVQNTISDAEDGLGELKGNA
jgi:hypothetical protein